MFATVMWAWALGTGIQAGEGAPRVILGKDDLHRIKEFDLSGWELWSFACKCTAKNVSTDNYRSMMATATGTQVVSSGDVRSLTETSAQDIRRMSSKFHNLFGQVVKGDHFAGNCNGIETWRDSPTTQFVESGGGFGRPHAGDVSGKDEEWLLRVDAFSWDHGEELSEIRDVARQRLDAQSSYRGISGKVPNLAVNWVSLEDPWPSPMGVGAPHGECEEGDAAEYVGAVGKGSRECWACGEQGNLSRESVTRGGKRRIGKGPKGKGPVAPGKEKGGPDGAIAQIWGGKGQKRANFRFQGGIWSIAYVGTWALARPGPEPVRAACQGGHGEGGGRLGRSGRIGSES